MALTRNDSQIQWSASDSITLSSATEQQSDTFTFDATDIAAVLQISVDNAGTPASGDVCNFRILWSAGDVLGGGGDDFDTSEHAEQFQVDTVAANTPGEDPVRKTVSLNHMIGAKSFKLAAAGPQAGTRNLTVRARVATQRAA